MVAHPPCTHLAVSGARWFKDKQAAAPAAQKEFYSYENCEDHIAKAKETIKEVGPKVREGYAVTRDFESYFAKYLKGVQYVTGQRLAIEGQNPNAAETKAAKAEA